MKTLLLIICVFLLFFIFNDVCETREAQEIETLLWIVKETNDTTIRNKADSILQIRLNEYEEGIMRVYKNALEEKEKAYGIHPQTMADKLDILKKRAIWTTFQKTLERLFPEIGKEEEG